MVDQLKVTRPETHQWLPKGTMSSQVGPKKQPLSVTPELVSAALKVAMGLFHEYH
jgi:hypothetical protein